MFGDLTTLTLSYGLGDDLVRSSVDPSFEEPLDRQIYGVGLTQILSKNLISAVNFEIVTEEGFLNNPYRVVRYLDPTNPRGFSFEPELYPNTRTTTAIGLRARYFLPYRAAVEGEYRWFTDTWDIDANTVAVSYIHPWGDWTFTGKFRWHDQTGAHFYRDIFARSQETNFRGRDKELSPLTSNTISLQAAYEFIRDDGNVAWGFIRRAKVTASLSMLSVDYHDFSDLTAGAPVGLEPLYQLDADIFQLYVSIFY
jgi:nuclear transport factor 2 (NTF2) superfamily protein